MLAPTFVANLQQKQQFVTKTPNNRCFSQKALAYWLTFSVKIALG
jgi:hypothetical protein